MNLISIIQEEINNIKKLMEVRKHFTTVYHGTSNTAAKEIIKYGIDIDKSTGGYFGWGFYTAIDYELARTNYAEFADENGIDEKGVVLEFSINPEANILDLRDEHDFYIWQPYSQEIYRPHLYKDLVANGIDGLYDNSFGGIVFYNSLVIKYIKATYL